MRTPGTIAAICLLVTACGGGASTQPAVFAVDPVATSHLEFRVGIATITTQNGARVAFGLNTVETLRQDNGLSAVLYSVPTIIGPTPFSISASAVTGLPLTPDLVGADYGTNHVSTATLNLPAYRRFFAGPLQGAPGAAPTVGAFGYGLCICNADSGPPNGIAPLYTALALPIYYTPSLYYYGGPPLFPSVPGDLNKQGFVGYSLGFTDFAIRPSPGTYRLDVAIPPTFQTPPTATSPVLSASAQLTSLIGLPAFPTPTFAADGNGGGTIAINVPVGATESLVFAKVDPLPATGGALDACNAAHQTTAFFTLYVRGTGTQTVVLPRSLGAADASGQPTRTICGQQPYSIYAVAFDYPAYESAYPQNLAPTPPIAAASGQADLSASDALTGTYP